jgi:hypothetical protein
MPHQPPPALALVRDLIFSSKIAQTGQGVGRTVTLIRDPAKLAGQSGPLLLVDLGLPGAIAAAASWQAAEPGRSVIGFVGHTDAENINQARAQGITQVLARSRFVEVLPSLLGDNNDVAENPD